MAIGRDFTALLCDSLTNLKTAFSQFEHSILFTAISKKTSPYDFLKFLRQIFYIFELEETTSVDGLEVHGCCATTELLNDITLHYWWKENFRVSRVTFEYFCRRVWPALQRQNTQMRDAIPVHKRVGASLRRFASAFV